jgi:hypothetical protein
VLAALADHDVHVPTRRLAVREMPTSGGATELLRWAGIDRGAIERAVRDLIPEETPT